MTKKELIEKIKSMDAELRNPSKYVRIDTLDYEQGEIL